MNCWINCPLYSSFCSGWWVARWEADILIETEIFFYSLWIQQLLLFCPANNTKLAPNRLRLLYTSLKCSDFLNNSTAWRSSLLQLSCTVCSSPGMYITPCCTFIIHPTIAILKRKLHSFVYPAVNVGAEREFQNLLRNQWWNNQFSRYGMNISIQQLISESDIS